MTTTPERRRAHLELAPPRTPAAVSWQAVVLAAIAALPGTIAAFLAYTEAQTAKITAQATLAQSQRLELRVDGRLTQLLKITEQAATDAAILKEREEQGTVAPPDAALTTPRKK